MGAEARRVREPIIVIGAPRSGTTLLTTLLEQHPDVAVSAEPRLVWRYRNDRRSDQLRPEHATAGVVDHIHRRFDALLEQRGARRLVEKTPANALRPGFVDTVFPDARYVHITRNGWGAVPSMRTFWERRATGFDAKQLRKIGRRLREARPSQWPFYAPELLRRCSPLLHGRSSLYGPHLTGLQEVVDELGVLEASALQWRSCVDQASTFWRAHASGRYFEVKIESLDAQAVTRLLDFCGLSPARPVLELFERRYRADVARHQAPLSEPERDLVAPYVMPANAWLGYSSPPCVPRSTLDEKGAGSERASRTRA